MSSLSARCRALLKFCFPVHSLLFFVFFKKISSTSLFGRTQYAEVVTDLFWVKRVPVERRIALARQQTCKAFRERGSLCEAKKESFFFSSNPSSHFSQIGRRHLPLFFLNAFAPGYLNRLFPRSTIADGCGQRDAAAANRACS